MSQQGTEELYILWPMIPEFSPIDFCLYLQNFGKCHSEISNASDYLTRCYSHEDRYLEKIPHVYTPLSDLPRDLYPHHSDISFCCPPPGSRAPYICPKEQYV